MAVIKLSSRGKSRGHVQANLRYISRGDFQLRDETGREITAADALIKYDFGRGVTDYRVIVTLPLQGTERAREIVEQVMCSRYHNFVQAAHFDDAKNPHIHFNLAAYKNHPLSQWQSIDRELKPLSSAIDKRFLEENISYNFKKSDGLTAVKTQCEIHREEKGLQNWKGDLRTVIKAALIESKDFTAFEKSLEKQGIKIARETDKTLTFQNSDGKKCRLNRLFSSLKNKEDIEKRIVENKDRKDRKADREGAKFISSFLSKQSQPQSQPSQPSMNGDRYEGGDEGIDERMTEDEKAAIRYRNRQRQVAAAQLAAAGPAGLAASGPVSSSVSEARELALQFREEKDELKLRKREEREIERERDEEEQLREDAEIKEEIKREAEIEEEKEMTAREEKIEEATEKLGQSKGIVKDRITEQMAQGSDKMYEEAGLINTLIRSDADLTNSVNQPTTGPGPAQQMLQRASRAAARKQDTTPTQTPSWRPGD